MRVWRMRKEIVVEVTAADRVRLEAVVADRKASPLRLPLHTDVSVVAERRRGLLRQVDKTASEAGSVPILGRPAGRHQPLRRRDQ